jgi:hypothetical protein
VAEKAMEKEVEEAANKEKNWKKKLIIFPTLASDFLISMHGILFYL